MAAWAICGNRPLNGRRATRACWRSAAAPPKSCSKKWPSVSRRPDDRIPMAQDALQIDIKDAVATIRLNRPDVHNAFDDVVIAALTAELRRIDLLPQVRVVVLAASGTSFSAGADLNWMRRMATSSRVENLRDALALAGLM